MKKDGIESPRALGCPNTDSMIREHTGRPLIPKQRRVGLEYNKSGRGICLEDAESPIRDDNVPTDADRLGEAAHGRENSFERMGKIRDHHPFDLRSVLTSQGSSSGRSGWRVLSISRWHAGGRPGPPHCKAGTADRHRSPATAMNPVSLRWGRY